MRERISTNIYKEVNKKNYLVYFNYGNNGNGKYIRKTKTFNDLKAARTALKVFEADKSQNRLVEPNDITFNEFIIEWLKYKETNCEAATIYGYNNMLTKHILPYMGNRKVREITASVINDYIYLKMKDSGDKNLSANTIIKHYDLLKQIFARAKDMDIIVKNPLVLIIPPKKTETEFEVYDVEKLQALFKICEDSPMEIVVKLAGYLGLRREEICGLRWSSVNLKNHTLIINHVRTYAGKTIEKAPKTKMSKRVLAVPDDIYGLLLKIKAEQKEYQMLLGIKEEYPYVFCREDGELIRPNYVSDMFKKIINDAHLPYVTLHRLRHSFTSIANELGVSIFEISKSLGHSSVKTTENIYTHLFEETHFNTISAVANALHKDDLEN